MGVKAATELMLSGKHLNAKAAAAAGLVDKLVEGDDALAAGLAYTRELLAAGTAVRRTRDIEITDKMGRWPIWKRWPSRLPRRHAACSRP